MLNDKARIALNETLTDLGFPSVNEIEPEDARMRTYRSVLRDAWGSCDQTEEDAQAVLLAHDAIDAAFA